MDELLKQLILGAPNLAVALWVIFTSQRTIARLLERQEVLIDALLRKLEIQAANNQKETD